MRLNILTLLVLGSLSVSGCGGGGPVRQQNFKSHWTCKLDSPGFPNYDLEVWVKGNRFRIHEMYQGASLGTARQVKHEFDLIYDGKVLWTVNGVTTPLTGNGSPEKWGIGKMELDNHDLAAIQFWKPGGGECKPDVTDTVNGVSCTRLLQRSAGMNAVNWDRVCIDPNRKIILKRSLGATYNGTGNDLRLIRQYTCDRMELAPVLEDSDFKFDPGSEKVTVKDRRPAPY